MASTSETGHQKNIENFEDLIGFYTGFSAKYNPTNNLITLEALNAHLTASRAAQQAVADNKPAFVNATNTRQELFETMRKTTTKVVNAFDATEAVTDKMVDDAMTTVRKIRGQRVGTIDPLSETSISVSQQSYDQLYNHFRTLVAYIKSEPTYDPNENELKPAQLDTLVDNLRAANKAVNDALVPYSKALKDRDKLLYGVKTGLVDRALESKNYVKSFGTKSAEYTQISGIKFTRPRKKKKEEGA